MDNDILTVNDVELSYKFYNSQALKHFLLNEENKKVQKFKALNGISFSVQRGTNLGIIGSNGSGKSTLLRILANTLTPDSGTVVNCAKSVSLLSLGVGFKPDLTGHENIYLNGLLLGLSKKEIEKRMEQIIEFAELGEFIYNPVRTYSSGMKSRLTFSIAINIDPDLLLIDEIFSVGDQRFKEKSKMKMESMIKDDRTVVMVSHSMEMIKQYCHNVLWIEGGSIKRYGQTDSVIDEYLSFVGKTKGDKSSMQNLKVSNKVESKYSLREEEKILTIRDKAITKNPFYNKDYERYGTGSILFRDFRFLDLNHKSISKIIGYEHFYFVFDIFSYADIDNVSFGLIIKDKNQNYLLANNFSVSKNELINVKKNKKITVKIKTCICLPEGNYYFTLIIANEGKFSYDRMENVFLVKVVNDFNINNSSKSLPLSRVK